LNRTTDSPSTSKLVSGRKALTRPV
jgi:hypothetical protein